jgi:hypothetical protein
MRLVAAAFAASLVVAGCGSDGGEDEPIPQSGERETTTTEETTTTSTPPTTEVAEDSQDAAAADGLQEVVTDDAAAGLDAGPTVPDTSTATPTTSPPS